MPATPPPESPAEPPRQRNTQGLTARAMARLDEAVLEEWVQAGVPQQRSMSRGASHGPSPAGSPNRWATLRSTVAAASRMAHHPSSDRPHDAPKSPSAGPQRSPQQRAATPEASTRGANRRRPAVATEEVLHWMNYRRRDVTERLMDQSHKHETLARLREAIREDEMVNHIFEPQLAPATVRGTHASPKRSGTPRQRRRDAATGVRVVTIEEPYDRRPSPETRRGPPHYMMPRAPISPPAPATRPPKLTARARNTKRTTDDLYAWRDARAELQGLQREEEQQEAETVLPADPMGYWPRVEAHEAFSPRLDDNSRSIVHGLGDRHIDVYAHADMAQRARGAEAKRRIRDNARELGKDLRTQPKPSRVAAVENLAPKPTLGWFTEMIRSDTTYKNNIRTRL